ncbi:MAG TPA: fumarylacetoacetate hydrolase family protein [Sandaracinaceae bacterium LLY-WYZ-13_1]|nr:fumarylacetoacetate hydrolase family protein [Sandaracinaceae bacterium LLY-WYZ-13_1]
MRFARARHEGTVRWVRLEPDAAIPLVGAPWDGAVEGGERWPADPELLAPVAPTKIVCVGRNYAAHARELGNEVPDEPLLFLKPPSALLAPGGTIRWPAASERIDYEGEVGVVVGRRLSGASPAEAADGLFAITCANDVTARDLQRRDGKFTRGKGFDGFCPVGPWLETDPPPLDRIAIETRVDGELRQRSTTARMVWPIAPLVAFMSGVMTLEPGDLILTGTPEGVGPLAAGQRVEVEVEGVGVLTHTLSARPVP